MTMTSTIPTTTTYSVCRAETPDGPWQVLAIGLDRATTSYRDSLALPNRRYFYQVLAHDGTDVRYSEPVAVMTPPEPLVAPVIKSVTALSHREVEIVWTSGA